MASAFDCKSRSKEAKAYATRQFHIMAGFDKKHATEI